MGNEERVYREISGGFLRIDEQGRIWRVGRRFYNSAVGETQAMAVEPRRMDRSQPSDGYRRVRFQYPGGHIVVMAHRLVWLHFNGPIPEGKTINHINGVKSDNRPENMELATPLEQREHCRTVLGKLFKIGPRDAATIRFAKALGAPVKDLMAMFGVSRTTIRSIVSNQAHVAA